ncbi:prolyl-tRNA synthetase associated domain-containing protein [Candidatus Merdisoma sp. JLR.KK006]|uniref:prolyl-tRNA synthetase associated domain-containing protein n=1 Tax=Candidatus Merdisoma sp. JLR.KK006 TaxID=3112626 RepID=UPI002FF1F4F4
MSEIYIDPHLYTTRPEPNGRLPKEMAVYDLLEQLQIPYIRLDHEVTPSIEACHDVDAQLGIEICKNLFLCNSGKNKFYLLMMPGTKQFKTKDLTKQINSSRLSFAPPEFMEKFLNITPGSVSILGLMNDREHQVQLVIDEDVVKQEYIGCHPCINTSSLKLKASDVLEKLLPAIEHKPIFVHL